MNLDSLVKHNGRNYLVPFILISSLFLLWGTAHSLLDVLNKHFQDALGISKAKSGLVQFAMYGGYFLAALPAGWFIRRFGYRRGIITGLLLFAAGAFLFIPVSFLREFWAVLTALFIIACGLAFLETAANPYSTILGPPESADRRINMSQSFNGIGWILGPLSGLIIFGSGGNHFESLALPYTILGSSVLIVALLFAVVPLPEVEEEQPVTSSEKGSLWTNRIFVFAVIAQFLYVAAQTGINSMFINYVIENTEHIHVAAAQLLGGNVGSGMFASPEATASVILAFGGMGCFFLGRFSGSFIMQRVKGERLLKWYATANVVLMAITVGNFGFFSIVTLFLSYFFMSIMFPTIFSLGVRGMGSERKRASSYLIMSIVGGAFCPFIMGWIADVHAMSSAFLVPMVCFGVILWFAVVAGREKR